MGGEKGTHKGHFPHGITMPDWREYKVDPKLTPDLWRHQERLAREGLKDPWLRNKAWMYQDGYIMTKTQQAKIIFRGFPVAVALFGLYVAWDKYNNQGHHHHPEDNYKLVCEMKRNQKHT